MEGSYPPGMTFGIISAEAVLRSGVSQATKFDCPATANVGGQTITNPSKQGRPTSSLQNDFAFSCATTLAQLSGKLDAATLLGEAGRFGIGKSWGLSVPHFAGSVPTPANDAEKAALAVGQGKVQVSPLSMALVAAAAENGAWKPPYLTKDTGEPKNSLIQPIDSLPLSDLKKLLRRSVTVGTAHEANTAGEASRAWRPRSTTRRAAVPRPCRGSWGRAATWRSPSRSRASTRRPRSRPSS